MNFALTEEQRLIQDSARAFLDAEARVDRRRAALASEQGWDEELWRGMSADMGWTAIAIPEQYGGAGCSAVEAALLLEEAGRALAMAPLFETIGLALPAIMAASTEQQKQALLPAIAAGEAKATLAFRAQTRACTLDDIGPEYRDGVLSGRAHYAPFAHVADLIVVAARTPGSKGENGVSLIALPAAADGVEIKRVESMDQTRPYATLSFNNARVSPEAVLGAPEGAGPAFSEALAISAGLLAAEQTGGAAYALDATVDYAKQRIQFGRAIGSFQAVKHRLADMMAHVEAARSAAYYAAAAIAEGSAETFEACAAARAYCSKAYLKCSADAIQLHGGIGFTWEHHAHLYFKRARASASMLGAPEQHLERLAQLIGLDQ